MPRGARRQPKLSDDPEKSQYGIIDRLIKGVSKKFTEDVIGTLETASLYSEVKDYISTQCYALDFALHLPGLPVGRIVTIRGGYASGKTTLSQHLLAETQKKGGVAIYIDTEYSFDKKRAKAIGIDIDSLVMVQPETVEETVAIIEQLVKDLIVEIEGGFDAPITIVWDSVAGTPTKEDADGEFGSSHKPGNHAKALSAALRRMARDIARYKILLVFVNQDKEKISFFAPPGPAQKTMVAENPLNFHSSVILTTTKIKELKNSAKEPIGVMTRVKVTKNKSAAPFSSADFEILFENPAGVNNLGSILWIASKEGIGVLKKAGSYYTFKSDDGETVKFQAKTFGQILDKYPEIMERLEAIKAGLALQEQKADEDEGDDDDTEIELPDFDEDD